MQTAYVSGGSKKSIPPGLKPSFVMAVIVWAEAQTYLEATANADSLRE
jgi:hypothetical protein